MKLTEYRNNIRQDLEDTNPTSQVYDDASIDRAVLKAVEDLTRWIPAEKFYDISVSTTRYTETYALAALPATFILARKPIYYGTVTVANGATVYVNDTDYVIDYINGTIYFPATSGAALTTLTITYELSRTIFDLSSLTDLIRITDIIYPYGRIPESGVNFELKGTLLTAIQIERNSQQILAGGQHMSISYDARHTVPDDNSDGTIPEVFSEIVIMGAEAFLLYARAISLELIAGNNLDTALAAIDPITAIFTLIGTDLSTALTNLQSGGTRITATVAAIDTEVAAIGATVATVESELLAVITGIGAIDLAGTKTDIDNVESGIDTIVATVNSTLALAEGMHVAIESDEASADTNIAAGLAFIDTEVVADLTSAATAIAAATALFTNATAEIAAADTDIEVGDANITAGVAYISSAAALINAVTVGAGPVGDYVALIDQETKIAEAFIKQGDSRLNSASAYLATIKELIEQGKGYQDNAAARMSLAADYLKAAETYIGNAGSRLAESDMYIKSAATHKELLQSKVGGFHSLLTIRMDYLKVTLQQQVEKINAIAGRANYIQMQIEVLKLYLQAAEDFISAGEKCVSVAGARLQEIQAYIASASETRAISTQKAVLALQIRTEAERRYKIFEDTLEDRNQTRRQGATVSARQIR